MEPSKCKLRSREERGSNIVSIEAFDNTSNALSKRVSKRPETGFGFYLTFAVWVFLLIFLFLYLRNGGGNMGKVEIEEITKRTLSLRIADQFLVSISKERRLSSYTSRNYRHAICSFFDWLSKFKQDSPIHKIGRMEARSYLDTQGKLAKTTIRNHFSALKGYSDFAQERVCHSNPFATTAKLEKKLQNFLSEKQAQSLMEKPLQSSDKVSKKSNFIDSRDQLILKNSFMPEVESK